MKFLLPSVVIFFCSLVTVSYAMDGPSEPPKSCANKLPPADKLAHLVQTGNTDKLERILSYDINALNTENKTPLYIAVENKDEAMIKFLLKHGASPDVQCSIFNLTPFTLAIQNQILMNILEE